MSRITKDNDVSESQTEDDVVKNAATTQLSFEHIQELADSLVK